MTYDPATTRGYSDVAPRNVTAFFDSRDGADKARADLIAAGLSPDAIKVVGNEAIPAEPVESAPYEEGGFWHALKEFFLPEDDRYSYAEGLRRGGFVVSVETKAEDYDRALDILDADGAVDIDEREQTWRSEGWTGVPTGLDPLAYAGPDNSTAGFGASLAGEDGYAPRTSRPATVEEGVAGTAVGGTLTSSGDFDAEARADPERVGTGAGEPGLLNPDMRERIGSGTASMTPPTPTGPQDGAYKTNAASFDRGLSSSAAAEDAALGSPTRTGTEAAAPTTTVGSTVDDGSNAAPQPSWTARRDPNVQRTRVRGFIVDPETGGSVAGGNI